VTSERQTTEARPTDVGPESCDVATGDDQRRDGAEGFELPWSGLAPLLGETQAGDDMLRDLVVDRPLEEGRLLSEMRVEPSEAAVREGVGVRAKLAPSAE
jgi:hypothetical protein